MLWMLLVAWELPSQEVQWASEVRTFSSEYSRKEWGAGQILGKPNVLPSFSNSPVAWSPKLADNGREWIEVAYDEPVKIRQIAIAENNNPGAITAVYTIDTEGTRQLVYENNDPRPLEENGRMLRIKLPLSTYLCEAIRIEMQCDAVPGFNHIDAVGISSLSDPIVAKIELAGTEFPSEPENLGPSINSQHGEVHPLISPDGKRLYYTRKYHPDNIGSKGNDDIWFSERDAEGNWKDAQNIGPPLNSEGHNYMNGITPDGNMALIAGNYGQADQKDKLYLSYRQQEGWSTPREIVMEDYYNKNLYNAFHLASDGKTILLSVERDEGFGFKDLYVSFKQQDGSWSKPLNCGPDINTAGDDTTPFLAPDGKTLYFSSDGFSGYGSNDIFVAKRLDNSWTHWSEPRNLGPAINSPYFESHYSVEASGEYAYFASRNSSYGKQDIFRILLEKEQRPELVALIKGKVVDAETSEAISAEIEYVIMPGEENAGFARSTPNTGDYQIVLPAGEAYTFFARARGYYSLEEEIDLRNIRAYEEIGRNIRMIPIKRGTVIQMEKISFEVNKAEILPASYPELNRIADFLRENTYFTIEISGHTNNLCDESFCEKLSEERARSVMKYLINKGIDKERMIAIGYGSKKPVADNRSAAGRKKNQRVELKILD